tara:strand:- start:618 stop:1208 length:591 start_codon:yes stop_codon:yes gene_type:complete
MIKLGIFLECDTELKDKIKKIKALFISKERKHKYLEHPVHMTFYVFNAQIKDIKEICKKLDAISKKIYPFKISINKWRVFENDILTLLNTLCLDIEKSDDLMKLQLDIGESMIHLHEENNQVFDGVFKKANKRYGYPFIGSHWIPHITIGSIDMPVNEILKNSNDSFIFPRELIIDNLSLYKIEDDTHQLLYKINF